jgi:hypothetical protein
MLPEEERTVTFHVDDTLVIECRAVADRLGLTLEQAVSFLVGMGIARGQDLGILGPRVTRPADLFAMLMLWGVGDAG